MTADRPAAKIKRVFLVTPPAFTFKSYRDINPMPPLGLGYLAAVLESRGIEVRIFDSLVEDLAREERITEDIVRIGASFEKIEEEIKRFAPDIVGVSNLFSRQAANAHRIYEIAKRVGPDITVIAGGAHPSVASETVMRDANVDYVVLGEGEATLVDLVEHLEGRKKIDSCDGIAFRAEDGVRVLPKTRFIEDLDSMPFPARHLLSMEKYYGLSASHGQRRHGRFAPIVTSRGCPAGCTFCTAHQVWGRRFRKRSPGNVIKEMRELKEKYGIREILFEDDNVTLDVKRAEELFDRMIAERLDLEWDTPNGVAAFALDEKLINKMKASGCYRLNIAVESADQGVLRNIIKKPLDLGKVRDIVKFARKADLKIGMYLIIGMPGETLGQMRGNYRFAKELGIYDAFVSVATPYPGSDLYDLCVKNGYIEQGGNFDKLYITSCSISTELWSGEDVRKVLMDGSRYLRFNYLIRHPADLVPAVLRKISKSASALKERIA